MRWNSLPKAGRYVLTIRGIAVAWLISPSLILSQKFRHCSLSRPWMGWMVFLQSPTGGLLGCQKNEKSHYHPQKVALPIARAYFEVSRPSPRRSDQWARVDHVLKGFSTHWKKWTEIWETFEKVARRSRYTTYNRKRAQKCGSSRRLAFISPQAHQHLNECIKIRSSLFSWHDWTHLDTP